MLMYIEKEENYYFISNKQSNFTSNGGKLDFLSLHSLHMGTIYFNAGAATNYTCPPTIISLSR